MGRFASRAGGVVCPVGRGVSGSPAIAHKAPRVEGAGFGVFALGKGTGRPLVGAGSGVERAAGKAARRGDGDGLHARLLPVGGGPTGDSAAGGLRNKTGMCKKT